MTKERIALPATSILTNITNDNKSAIRRSMANYSDCIHIVYHKDCLDGTVAGFTAWLLSEGRNPEAIPMSYQDSVPDMFLKSAIKRTILFVDFCVAPDILEAMAMMGHTVVVIDHHKSAIDKIMDYPKELTNFWYFVSHEHLAMTYDQKHSGASLTHVFFNYLDDKPLDDRPDEGLDHLITLAREHDLWLHNGDPQTDAMALSYWHKGKSVASLCDYWLANEFSVEGVNSMVAEGRVRLDKAVAEIKEVIKCGCLVRIGGNRAWLFYCERAYTSLAGSIVNRSYDIAISFYKEGDKFKMSIRTAEGSHADASKLAGIYGGGGHQHAAGFYTDVYPAVLLKRSPLPPVALTPNVVINPNQA